MSKPGINTGWKSEATEPWLEDPNNSLLMSLNFTGNACARRPSVFLLYLGKCEACSGNSPPFREKALWAQDLDVDPTPSLSDVGMVGRLRDLPQPLVHEVEVAVVPPSQSAALVK